MLFSDFSSYVFNLIVFSALAAGLAVILLGVKSSFKKASLYNIFLVLGVFAVLTQLSYVHAPQRIFSNASHHIIEQIGFSFIKTLDLANEETPEKAIWDSKKGNLRVELQPDNSFLLTGRNFFEPVFLSTPDNDYKLSNPILARPLAKNLSIALTDSLSLDFKIDQPEENEEVYSFAAVVNGIKYGPFPVSRKNLRTGYSLAGLLAETNEDFPEKGEFLNELQNSWIIRDKFNPDHVIDITDNPLYFFPSKTLLDSSRAIVLDGNPVAVPQDFHFEVPVSNTGDKKQEFYTGLWTTRNRVFTLYCKDSKSGLCEINPTYSDKKQLKKLENKQESLFITSSSDDVADNELLSGFYYPLFDEDANQNHFSATIAYNEGNTRQQMKFRVVSTDKNDLTASSIRLLNAGDTIRLETTGASGGLTSNLSLFKITDLKAVNPLQFWHMAVFTLLLILCIYISFYLTKIDDLTKTEVIAYILLLVLLTIRSILLWRVSTFPPLEDISASVYKKMVETGFLNFDYGVRATAVFFLAIWTWKLRGQWLAAKFSILHQNFLSSVLAIIVAIVAFYSVSFGLKLSPSLTRIGSVFAPLVSFFLAEFLLLLYAEKAGRSTRKFANFKTLSALNWLICFGYLALSDAGFSIVFTMSSLLYWLLRLLVFPDHQYRSETSGKYRHLMFILPFALLLTILFFSPYLLSFVFQQISDVLYGIVGLLLCFAAYMIVRKVVLWENNPWVSRAVTTIMIGAATIILVMPETITKKIHEKTYIRYRAEVLIHTPDEILEKEEFKFNLGNDSKLLRAAQNQWIINHYYEKGNLGLYDYFRLLPSFQKGSPYMTQISDLVTVRYLIGEHSQYVVIQVLFLMLVLVFSALSGDTRFNIFSKVRVQILCILFMVGFFIWMAATNRMIFLGQDFPLLSLNSLLTLFFSFSILFAAIALGQLANNDPEKTPVFNTFGRDLGYTLARGLLVVGTLLIWIRQYDLNSKKFDLDETVEQLQTAFIPINDLFADYQQQHQPDTLQARPDSIGNLIAQFDLYIQHDKDSLFKTRFSRSAYEAYRTKLSRQNSGENLVHLRRGSDGIYTFAVNKLYYNVSSPDVYEQAWKGNILAARNPKSFSFQNRDSKADYVMDIDRSDENFGATLEKANFMKMKENQNLRLTVIPAGWKPDSTPSILVSRTSGTMHENRSDFLIKNGIDIFRSADIDQAMVLLPNDVIQFIPDGEKNVASLQYRHQNTAYLAKNVWLNGRRQFYYPLREKFLWSYYFTNLVKNKFDREATALDRNVQVTIDQDITNKISVLAADYYATEQAAKKQRKEDPSENARAFNLVVLDDLGNIRALCDYKKGDKVKVNPNRMNDYASDQDVQYLDTDIDRERLMFGNRCLMRMDNGPASTFKPIMYSAVTSQYNFNWPKLKLGEILKEGLQGNEKSDYVIHRFGGKSGLTFTVPSSNIREHDMEYYISRSTNTYNSMIVFLGSLDRSEIDKVYNYANRTTSQATFLSRGPSKDTLNTFPNFKYNGESYFTKRFPNWKNSKSIMALGLWENFNLPTRWEHLNGAAGQHIQNIAANLDSSGFDDSRSTYKLWSFPEPSHAYAIDRIDLHTAIVQLSTGASPIYATPLKMAEMAGKLFSFNRDYKASVIESTKTPYSALEADVSWGSPTALSTFYSQNLFVGMNKALLDGGTAHELVGKKLLGEFSGYYFYAKTGTISGNRYGGKRDKHLMLIISKNQLHDRPLTPGDLKNNKFYVLYFSFYKQSYRAEWGAGVPTLLQEMARTVIKSPGFKAHMQ